MSDHTHDFVVDLTTFVDGDVLRRICICGKQQHAMVWKRDSRGRPILVGRWYTEIR